MPKTDAIQDVKPVTFEKFMISEDGEQVVFEIRDRSGQSGHIAINWLNLAITVQLFGRAAEKASERRGSLGKSDLFDGSAITPQLVSTFQVSAYPTRNLKILSLHSPVGFRCDFAIPTNTVDQLGRAFPRAIAEELLQSTNETPQ